MFETYKNIRKTVDENPDMYTISDADLEKIQSTLLSMINDIDTFCVNNNISYALCGGSCLGAVRHHGFIPWDDDMDICMPRKDYERFISLFTKDNNSVYIVQNVRTTDHYDLNFSKVRKKGTVFEEIYETCPEDAGMFIDIFPVDGTFSNKFLRTIHQALCDGLLLICSCVRMREKKEKLIKYTGNDASSVRAIKFKSALGKCFSFLSLKRWLLITEGIISLRKSENTKFVMIPSGIRHAKGETYLRSWFFPSRKIQFNGRTLYTLNHPKPYLKKLYGDFMKLPPESDRLHHSVLNFHIPD